MGKYRSPLSQSKKVRDDYHQHRELPRIIIPAKTFKLFVHANGRGFTMYHLGITWLTLKKWLSNGVPEGKLAWLRKKTGCEFEDCKPNLKRVRENWTSPIAIALAKYGVKRMADDLGCGLKTVYGWVKLNEIPKKRLEAVKVLLRQEDIKL